MKVKVLKNCIYHGEYLTESHKVELDENQALFLETKGFVQVLDKPVSAQPQDKVEEPVQDDGISMPELEDTKAKKK